MHECVLYHSGKSQIQLFWFYFIRCIQMYRQYYVLQICYFCFHILSHIFFVLITPITFIWYYTKNVWLDSTCYKTKYLGKWLFLSLISLLLYINSSPLKGSLWKRKSVYYLLKLYGIISIFFPDKSQTLSYKDISPDSYYFCVNYQWRLYKCEV